MVISVKEKLQSRKQNGKSNVLLSAEPTEAYDTYWRFAAERQEIFYRRLNGSLFLTDDPVLLEYKFTNAYRVLDRVSQYLISNVIQRGSQEPDELFFRIVLFKIFNKIETWKLLQEIIPELSIENYKIRKFDNILERVMNTKQPIFSAAYIMPSGSTSFGHSRKHKNYLYLLNKMLKDELPKKIQNTKSMKEGFSMLRSYPMLGDFLAYQFITDLNYSNLTNFSETEFVMPGPGAIDGIHKCFAKLGDLTEANIIQRMYEVQEDEFSRLDLKFKKIGNKRKLQLIDLQNVFCEVGKYCRVAHPTILGKSGRTRIKQKFRSKGELPSVVLPLKWKISHV